MNDELAAAIDRIEALVTTVDADCLDPRLAVQLVGLFARGERLCAAGKTLAAGRVDSSGAWAAAGDKTTAAWLARTTGTSVADAIGTIQTARHLGELPATNAALRAGRLSPAQARTVADAASVAPAVEQGLLDSAARNGLAGLQRDAVRAKAAGEDAETRKTRQHRARAVRTWTDDDGMSCGRWRLPAEIGGLVCARLKTEADRVFHAARRADARDSVENYAADAFVKLMCSGVEVASGSLGPRADVTVHVDYDALLRGDTFDGERCEIAGVGPIPVQRARDYLLGGAFLKLLIARGVDVRSVCHYGRHIPAELRTAIECRDRECIVERCHRADRLEIHHLHDHAKRGPTALFNLVALCRHHHDLVTHRGYGLSSADQRGSRKLIPPATPPPS
jgi:hypothetical protein